MKAVMWTDVVQVCFMVAGILAVIIKGSLEHGGFGNIWSVMYDDQRIQFWEYVQSTSVCLSVVATDLYIYRIVLTASRVAKMIN